MSLTGTEQVFGAIHEDALNDMIHAFFNARPRYRRYGSPAFVPATTVAATQMGAIPFPGSGGIEWRVSFTIPVIDLFKQTRPLPPELSLAPGQFSLNTRVEICLNCAQRKDDQQDPTGKDHGNDRPGRPDHVICTALDVFGIGHLDSWHASNGSGAVRLRVDAVELVDVTPDSLESVLECLIKMVLDAALSQVQLPLSALRAGAFQLVVVTGPSIDDDQIKVTGNL
jgi:hypothetical protein